MLEQVQGASGLLTPNQFINVYNYADKGVDALGSHKGTYMMILNNIYDLGIENSDNGYPNEARVLRKIPHGLDNFVQVQYIVQKGENSILITMPKYITNYQYEELEVLKDTIKNYNIIEEVRITNYNPIRLNKNNDSENYFSNDNALENALQYMVNNKRIVDYELPFREEKMFNYGFSMN